MCNNPDLTGFGKQPGSANQHDFQLGAQVNPPEKPVRSTKSPSCGSGIIYEGSFTGRLAKGDGVFAEACKQAGMEVRTEEEI
jgi:uncharacterized protein YbbK (DUF523 family)